MGRTLTIQNPSFEIIEQVIDSLIPITNYFVILKPAEPIFNSLFIQTLMEANEAGETRYLVEISFMYSNERKFFRRYIDNADELKEIFCLYSIEKIPDITDWTDVTADIMTQITNKKME